MIQLAIDWHKDIRVNLQLNYENDAAATAGEGGAKEGIAMARQAMNGLRKQIEEKLTPKSSDKSLSPLEELPETALALVALGSLKQADEILADLPVTRSGSALASTATIPAGPITSALSMYGYSAAFLLPAVQKVRMGAGRAKKP